MRTVGRALLATTVLAVLVAGGFGGALADGPAPSPAEEVGDVAGNTAGAIAPSGGPAADDSDRQSMRPRAGAGTGDDVVSIEAGPTDVGPAMAASTDDDGTSAAPGIVAPVDASDASAATDATAPQSAGQADEADVSMVQEYRLTPDRPGNVSVTYRYALADRIVTLETQVPERATVLSIDGFDARNATTYVWDETTAAPSLTYSLPVNETGSRSAAAADGSLLFADAGDWAMFQRPPTDTYWEAFGRDRVTFDREIRTVGPGAAGDWLVFLGPVDLHAATAENQTFRLAVPAAANLTESPGDVLAAMERASADLDVGDRDESVFAVAAPTDGVPWAVRGLSTGDADFWVGADERLDTTDNVWVHEYVHTRQAYLATPATRWTTEGFASYFAARHALKYQTVTFGEFAASLSVPDDAAKVTLAEPDSWENTTAYERGATVAGQLDRRIRLASGGERNLETVLAGMNADPGRLNATELFSIVGTAGGEDVREYAIDAVTADRLPSMWNRSQHVAAFGGLPAQFSYELAPPDGSNRFRVTGPFRNGSLDGDGQVTIVPGETLVANARVTNAGDKPGFFEAPLEVNGTVVDVADGRMAGNGSTIVSLTHTFDAPGEYTVGVGNDTAIVVVRRPATASIVDFTFGGRAIQQYGTATLNVTVRNDATVPARRVVPVSRDAHAVGNRTVFLGPNATVTASIPIRFPEAGTSAVTVGDAGTVQVVVRPREMPTTTPTPTSTPTPTATPTAAPTNGPADAPPDDGSGTAVAVGASVALLALATVLAVARYRESRDRRR